MIDKLNIMRDTFDKFYFRRHYDIKNKYFKYFNVYVYKMLIIKKKLKKAI